MTPEDRALVIGISLSAALVLALTTLAFRHDPSWVQPKRDCAARCAPLAEDMRDIGTGCSHEYVCYCDSRLRAPEAR